LWGATEEQPHPQPEGDAQCGTVAVVAVAALAVEVAARPAADIALTGKAVRSLISGLIRCRPGAFVGVHKIGVRAWMTAVGLA
jgi:hypothetical protein